MTNVALCRVCLASDSRMYDIKGTRYQGIFEKLSTKLYTPDQRPKTMCYICVSLLHRCRRFVDMSRRAENVLTQLSVDGIQVTQENVAELNLSLKQSLSVTPIHYLFTGNIQKSTHVVVQEDSISMEEEKTSDEELLVETDDSSYAVVKEHALFIKEVETPDEELLKETTHTDDGWHVVDKENDIFIKEVETANQELLIDAVHEDSSRVVLQKEVISMKEEETAGEELLVETAHTADSSYAVVNEDVFNNVPSKINVKQPKFKTTYSCDYCNRTCKAKSKLALHIKQYHTSQLPFSDEEQLNRIANSERHLRVYSGELIKAVETAEEEHLIEAVHTDDSSHAVVKEDATFMMKVETADEELLVETAHDDSSCVVLQNDVRQNDVRQNDVISMEEEETAGEELLLESVYTADSSYAVVNEDVFNNVPSKINVKQPKFNTTYSCDYCNRTFNAKSKLVLHIYQCHTSTKTQKPFSGNKQLNQIPDTYGLQRQIVPYGEKTFACAFCDKVYAHKTSLRVHERVHTGEKPYACALCDSVFAYKRDLRVHMREHTGEKPYACNICGVKFNKYANLTMHMRIHTGIKPHACHICGKLINQKRNLTIHMRIHTQEKPYSCDICGKAFVQKQNLNTHQKLHAPEKQYSCDICSKTYYVRESLIRHYKKVHTEKTVVSENFVPSEICNIISVCSKVEDDSEKQLNLKASSERHMRVHSGEFIKNVKTAEEEHLVHTDDNSHAVVKEDATLMMKVETADEELLVETVHDNNSCVVLQNDVRQNDVISMKEEETAGEELLVETAHTADSSYAVVNEDVFTNVPSKINVKQPKFKTTYCCDYCNRTCNAKSELVLHINQCHTSTNTQKPFSGNKQLNQIPDTYGLQRQIVPSEEKTFACAFCDKVYAHKSSLRAHVRVHTKPVACALCDEVFAYKQNLRVHMREHTGEKPYACNICGVKFSKYANLKMHMRIHNGEKPHACHICGKLISQKGNLTTHMRIHTQEKPYSCDICGKAFNQKQNLNTHQKIHAPEKQYSCDLCSKSYHVRANLIRHKEVHTEKTVVSENFVPSEICNIISVCSKVEDDSEKQLNLKASSERHLRVHSGEFIKDMKTAEEEHLVHTDDSSHAVVKEDAMFMMEVETAGEGLLVETVHSDDSPHAVVKEDAMFMMEVETADEGILVETVHSDDSPHAVVKADAVFIKKEETAEEELLEEATHTNVSTVSSKEGPLIVTPTVHTQNSSYVTDTKEAISMDVSENLLSSEISNIISIRLELEDDSDHDVYNNLPTTMNVEQPKFETSYRCELCNESFDMKRKLTLHIKRCHISQMQFSGEKKHNMGVHSKEKPFACALCGQAYARKSNLIVHQRVHTGEKPYACDICGKKFSLSTNLTIHMRVHTREKPYSCNICGKDFAQKQSLKSHGRIHTREEPYACNVCGKTFRYKATLQSHHIRLHQKCNPAII